MNRRRTVSCVVAVFLVLALGLAPGLGSKPSWGGEMRQAVLTLGKLTCASCAFAIQAALRKVDGVKEAKVSYRDKRAVVDYDSARVKPEDLVAVVGKAGFSASVAASGSRALQGDARE